MNPMHTNVVELLTGQKMEKRPRRCVLYQRISTKGQTDGISLDAQQSTLQTHVEQLGGMVLDTFQDVASAYGPKASHRKGLLDAISKCRATGAELLVTKVDRFSRNVSILTDLDLSGLKITSVAEGRIGKQRLRSLITSAQRESAEASRRSKEVLAKKKTAGKPLGNPNIRRDAQRAGTDAVKQRRKAKILDLSVFIENHPEILAMTWQERGSLLNSFGHLNPGSVSVPWTKSALRKPFKDAVELLALGRSPLVCGASSGGSKNVLRVAGPAGVATTPPSTLQPTTAEPFKAESQGASQGMPATSSTGLSSGSKIAILSPASAATPALSRRPLTEAEKALLLQIIAKRKVATKTVMDELGLPRLNGSLWMAVHQGTTVSEDMLERLVNWFDTQIGVLLAAA
jgi:DNA invertase Pin-like site-specific DNA recombinase